MDFQINKVTAPETANYRPGGTYNVGKTGALFLHPAKNDFLSNANLQTTALKLAAIQALLVNSDKKARAQFMGNLIMPENKGEGMTFDTRDQYKFAAEPGTFDLLLTIKGTYADYQKARKMLKNARKYKFILADLGDGTGGNFNIRHTVTSTGIAGFRIFQAHVMPLTEPTPGKPVMYQIRLAAEDINEINTASHTELGFNPYTDLQSSLIEDVWLSQITSGTAGTFKFTVSGVEGEENFAELYKGTGELKQVGAFTVVNAAGVAIPKSSISGVLTGSETTGFALALDTLDASYTVGQKAYIYLSAPATIQGYTGLYMESNRLEVVLT